MENVPPPPGLGWPARGTKRTHNQMSGRDPAFTASRITRSPSTPNTLDHSNVTSRTHSQRSTGSEAEEGASGSSSAASSPPQEIAQEVFEQGRRVPSLLRLPSFQELDAGRAEESDRRYRERTQRMRDEVRDGMMRDFNAPMVLPRYERRSPVVRPTPPAMETIDLTGDDEEPVTHWLPERRMPGHYEEFERTVDQVERAFDEHDMERDIANRPQRQRSRPFGPAAQRGPRFPGAEIIDLSADTPARPQDQSNMPHNASSPEVQFLRSRQISPRRRNAGSTPFTGSRPTTPAAARPPNRLGHAGRLAPIDLTIDDDDDVEILREVRHEVESPPPALPANAGLLNNLYGIIGGVSGAWRRVGMPPILAGDPRNQNARDIRDRARERAQMLDRRRRVLNGGGGPGAHHRPGGAFGNFVAPVLDFGNAAFDLGYGVREPPVVERAPSPDPVLPAAPDGFTRNPTEEDVLVCPACDAELSVDGDDTKRQVWLLKKCGHIYCGECAASRLQKAAPKRGKGKAPIDQAPPLKTCAVDGCTSKTGGKQMIQLFL